MPLHQTYGEGVGVSFMLPSQQVAVWIDNITSVWRWDDTGDEVIFGKRIDDFGIVAAKFSYLGDVAALCSVAAVALGIDDADLLGRVTNLLWGNNVNIARRQAIRITDLEHDVMRLQSVKTLSGASDDEVAAEYHYRLLRKLGDPRLSIAVSAVAKG